MLATNLGTFSFGKTWMLLTLLLQKERGGAGVITDKMDETNLIKRAQQLVPYVRKKERRNNSWGRPTQASTEAAQNKNGITPTTNDGMQWLRKQETPRPQNSFMPAFETDGWQPPSKPTILHKPTIFLGMLRDPADLGGHKHPKRNKHVAA